ncbi:hypothetical protein ES703_56508 [subsurface metagenome]
MIIFHAPILILPHFLFYIQKKKIYKILTTPAPYPTIQACHCVHYLTLPHVASNAAHALAHARTKAEAPRRDAPTRAPPLFHSFFCSAPITLPRYIFILLYLAFSVRAYVIIPPTTRQQQDANTTPPRQEPQDRTRTLVMLNDYMQRKPMISSGSHSLSSPVQRFFRL